MRASTVTRLGIALLLALWLTGDEAIASDVGAGGENGGGGVAVRAVAEGAVGGTQRDVLAGVLAELGRREGEAWTPVFRSFAGRWAVAGLPPGEYRLKILGRLDEAGNALLKGGKLDESVTYEPDRWTLTWRSRDELRPDDVVTVTIEPKAVEDLGGRHPDAALSFVFKTGKWASR